MKIVALALVSSVYGLIAYQLFRRLTVLAQVRNTVNQIVAHILEFSLYIDEPRIILKAQRDLLRENFRLLRQIALPTLILAAAFAILYGPMDGFFGHGPLPPNAPSVITVGSDARQLELQAPPGIIVETPAIRILKTHQTSWRVRPIRPATGQFRVFRQGRQMQATVDIPYPETHWLIWFLLISTAAAGVAFHLPSSLWARPI